MFFFSNISNIRISYRIKAVLFLIFIMNFGCTGEESREHAGNSYLEWQIYGGDYSSTQYSDLDQINRENVHKLEVAWIFNTGDRGEDNRTQIQCSPIVIDSILYGTSPRLKLFAIDAANGKEIWHFDPFSTEKTYLQGLNRGVAYWESEDGMGARILFTAGSRLYALDANTGQLIPEFGDKGIVDLKKGLDRIIGDTRVDATTPGTIYKNLLILGSRVSEGKEAAPGHIRAFNVQSGDQVWIFHTIPHPGEFGYDTWPKDTYLRGSIGGANAWSGMSLDYERGIIFIPTGSPAFDFYGGNREGANLFGNCLLALDASSGERIWHFQIVHHDIWDRDLPATPNLVTIKHNGKEIDVVAQITKSGYVFIFNRETGEPIFQIEEQPVESSDLHGEQTWPTQPFPVKPPPFARQIIRKEDLTNISSKSQAIVMEQYLKMRSGHQFVPPSLEGTIIFPGLDGGGEWGGAAVDPQSGILYVNANEMPWILKMIDLGSKPENAKESVGILYKQYCAACHGTNKMGDGTNKYPSLLNLKDRLSKEKIMDLLEIGQGDMPSFKSLPEKSRKNIADYLLDSKAFKTPDDDSELQSEYPYAFSGYGRFLDPDGYPAVKPPWGTLNAIDLNKGEIVWQVPLGEFEELSAKGIVQTGTENYGGPIVTAGGLIFIGASKDENFRAFDKNDGKELWHVKLPAGGYATPCTYEFNGKQYVVIAAGGGKMGTKSGDAYVAFALPD
jgi:quinoprotein glucose dehydrogenase